MNKSLFGSNIVYVLNISLLLHLDLVSINQIIDTSKAGYFSERRSEGSWLLVDRLSWVWWCSCHSVFETRILRKLSDVRSWNYIIALIGSNYFERPERTNSRDDVWAARQDTWTRYCSRVVMASRERDVVAVRRWRWLRDKLRHVYRAIKYMSGKSLSCYRSEVSFSSWAREGRLRRKKSERNGQKGKFTKLLVRRRRVGDSTTGPVHCLLSNTKRSFRADGKESPGKSYSCLNLSK